jgi:hypothetical protein
LDIEYGLSIESDTTSVSSVASAVPKVFSATEQPAAEYTTFFRRLKPLMRS